MPADLLITHVRQLYSVAGPGPLAGPAQSTLEPIVDGLVAIEGDRITYAGTAIEYDMQLGRGPHTKVVDLGLRYSLVPGFVDPHTHVVYAGNRLPELRRRLAGATYAEIAADGGGIVSTVEATRRASAADLANQTRARLDEMLAAGTTTAEAKSGYGLDTATERRMLEVIKVLNEDHAIDLVPTFMGAHDIPVEYRGRQAEYVDLVIDEMLPACAPLAEWCDVFCEKGVFTPDESVRILEAGMRHGLKPRIHADELGASGGSQAAVRAGAASADHLVHATTEGIGALLSGGVIATLLPCAAFYLKLGRFAPARQMIEAGLPVALATDVNPGGGFSPSMPFAMALACFGMNLTFEEALAGATLNAAASLERDHEIGSLEAGKLADAVIVRGDATELIRVNASPITAVVKRGRLAAGSWPVI
ncbi:MAG: imidazolonepropionase [Acidobacteriota bacterium]|nr:imidazolonepropionase [Acidobacteriota bacterium]